MRTEVATIGLLVALGAPAVAQPLPTTEEFLNILTVCGAGSGIDLTADIEGSIRSLYDAERTEGTARRQIIAGILELLPEDQRLAAYTSYLDCVDRRLQGSGTSSGIPKFRGDITLSDFANNDLYLFLQKNAQQVVYIEGNIVFEDSTSVNEAVWGWCWDDDRDRDRIDVGGIRYFRENRDAFNLRWPLPLYLPDGGPAVYGEIVDIDDEEIWDRWWPFIYRWRDRNNGGQVDRINEPSIALSRMDCSFATLRVEAEEGRRRTMSTGSQGHVAFPMTGVYRVEMSANGLFEVDLDLVPIGASPELLAQLAAEP